MRVSFAYLISDLCALDYDALIARLIPNTTEYTAVSRANCSISFSAHVAPTAIHQCKR